MKNKKNIQTEDYQGLISDLMASLTFIFIIAMMAVMVEQKDLEKNIIDSKQARKELLDKLKEELKEVDQNIKVEVVEEHGILRIADGNGEGEFFQKTQEIPTRNGRLLLETVARVLKKQLNCTDTEIDKLCDKSTGKLNIETMLLEGHTDSANVVKCYRTAKGSKVCDNLTLSKNRAYQAFKIIERSMGKEVVKSFKNKNNQNIMSISGYGDSRLLKGKGINKFSPIQRRIDIRFLMHEPDKESIRAVDQKIEREVSGAYESNRSIE